MNEDPLAPRCPPPDFAPRRPRVALAPGACDSHAHVLGPAAIYPYAAQRVYTPDDCVLADYRRMLDTLGVERAVLVQPSVYGTDNRAMLDALATDPARLRGVAVVDASIDDARIEQLHAAGVRGIRINVVDVRDARGRLPLDDWHDLAGRIVAYGWHVEFLLHVDEFATLDESLADFPAPVVFGHLGYMQSSRGLDTPGFQAMLRLVRARRAWVKLTGPYRISGQALPHADLVAYARAIVDAGPEQVVWGTDWPHVMVKGAMPNDADIADLLSDWIPDERIRQQVLVGNPARLYGFD